MHDQRDIFIGVLVTIIYCIPGRFCYLLKFINALDQLAVDPTIIHDPVFSGFTPSFIEIFDDIIIIKPTG